MIYSVVRYNDYQDSVVMMNLTSKIRKIAGVHNAAVMMGTNLNKHFLGTANLLTDELKKATANDLCISVEAGSKDVFDCVVEELDSFFNKRQTMSASAATVPGSIEEAVKHDPQINLALISVPGEYAAFEAEKALDQNLNVFLFSDNVDVQDEIRLKKKAVAKNLLMMGPDCGTAIINGVGLGFTNVIAQGPIGIIGASGTGIQEVISRIAKRGGGISQAIGTGGRDLSKAVGGIAFKYALRCLMADQNTKVLVLISKPPDPEIFASILAEIKAADKPVVMCLPGYNPNPLEAKGIVFAKTLSHAGEIATALLSNEEIGPADIELEFKDEIWNKIALETSQDVLPGQKYVRGLFSGGTLADEAAHILAQNLDPVYSNQSFGHILSLPDPAQSYGHCIIDLGDDLFTKGKPHPMIDPTDRAGRIVKEAEKLEAKVLLLDVVLGYGSHEDPAGELAQAISKAKTIIKNAGGYLSVVASVCGTEGDKQGYQDQINKLKESGAIVMPSNAMAAKFASVVCLRN